MMWRDMNLIRLVKQVIQLLYGNDNCYTHEHAHKGHEWLNVALALIQVVETNQIRVS